MAKELRLRRGTTAQHAAFRGAEGEVTVDVTKDTLVIHDGVTVGGKSALATEAQLALKQDSTTAVQKDSSTGAAYIPRGTTAQRPVAPTAGYTRFNTDLVTMEVWNGTSWTGVGGGATGGGTDNVFIENEYTITANYTIPAGRSAVSVGNANGDIILNSGVDITFGDNNSRWVVL